MMGGGGGVGRVRGWRLLFSGGGSTRERQVRAVDCCQQQVHRTNASLVRKTEKSAIEEQAMLLF